MAPQVTAFDHNLCTAIDLSIDSATNVTKSNKKSFDTDKRKLDYIISNFLTTLFIRIKICLNHINTKYDLGNSFNKLEYPKSDEKSHFTSR